MDDIKPGDVIKPDKPQVPLTPAESAQQATAAPAETIAPPVTAPSPMPEPALPTPKVEETPPAVPPPIQPALPAAPVPAHKMKPIFALILIVILLVLGALLYFMYFKDLMTPVPAPAEVNESTESTPSDRTREEDTTSLQYLENQFRGLDNSAAELTNDTEVQSQLNVVTGTGNTSEL